MRLQRPLRFIMAIVLLITCSGAHADDMGLLSDIKPPQQTSEYIFRSSPKESLVTVQLLGAVNKPGIYYVPAGTDLLKLITLAGGTTNGGDLSEVIVRKMEPKTWAEIKSKAVNEYQGAFEVDAEKLIKYGGTRSLRLHQDDFVYVPPRTPWISNETARGITLVSVILGIALTAVLIDKNTGNN
ncbi:MAG: hypothetical protein OM95_04840 [Bdellovibrio sp. ArHS]|uniref:SLBB domain-containing protein n=1 Tax=Bdellovibrio sp. ArHS TaxID=1569284 RepID=UPI0005832E66|nr:SLBB domain-containing protein [Bdellovibrio sp. ArHS]KHD89154.1 MAG: hypothetical protein OM95_04840 [Bdellovibrio sp. ArHS]